MMVRPQGPPPLPLKQRCKNCTNGNRNCWPTADGCKRCDSVNKRCSFKVDGLPSGVSLPSGDEFKPLKPGVACPPKEHALPEAQRCDTCKKDRRGCWVIPNNMCRRCRKAGYSCSFIQTGVPEGCTVTLDPSVEDSDDEEDEEEHIHDHADDETEEDDGTAKSGGDVKQYVVFELEQYNKFLGTAPWAQKFNPTIISLTGKQLENARKEANNHHQYDNSNGDHDGDYDQQDNDQQDNDQQDNDQQDNVKSYNRTKAKRISSKSNTIRSGGIHKRRRLPTGDPHSSSSGKTTVSGAGSSFLPGGSPVDYRTLSNRGTKAHAGFLAGASHSAINGRLSSRGPAIKGNMARLSSAMSGLFFGSTGALCSSGETTFGAQGSGSVSAAGGSSFNGIRALSKTEAAVAATTRTRFAKHSAPSAGNRHDGSPIENGKDSDCHIM